MLDELDDAVGDGDAEAVAPLRPERSAPRTVSTARLARLVVALTGWTCAFGTTAARALAAAASVAELYWMIVVDDGATALPVPTTVKWLWVSDDAAFAAKPPVLVALSTLTWTLAGLTAGPEADGEAEAVGVAVALALDGTVWSCAISPNSWDACGCSHSTRLASVGSWTTGTWVNWTPLVLRPFMLVAMLRMSSTDRPLSVVSVLATSRAMANTLGTWASTCSESICCSSAAMKNCCRWMRCRSEPRPTCRSRTKASAWAPLTWCSPAVRFSPEAGSLIASGRQTLTPPRSLTTDVNPLKLISTKWLM